MEFLSIFEVYNFDWNAAREFERTEGLKIEDWTT